MTSSKIQRHALGTLILLATMLVAGQAMSQGELPGIAPMGSPRPPTSSDSTPRPSDAPETHAASGGTETTLPEGDEPALPEEPLAMSKKTLERIGSDSDVEAMGTDKAQREFYGLYYNEKAGEYRYRVAFPAWAERKKPSLSDPGVTDRASIFGGVYYNRRAADVRDDIVFPVMWNLREPLAEKRTTVVGPFVNRRTKKETDDWLLPFYATGTRPDGGYTILPPLLTYRNRDINGGLNIVGPAFCSWEGGQSCDVRTSPDIKMGVAPFY